MKILLYCTKSNQYLYKRDIWFVDKNIQKTKYITRGYTDYDYDFLNGKIVAECDYEVEKMGLDTGKGLVFDKGFNEESQLKLFEIAKYVGNNYYYVIHIKNLHIFDEPRELRFYYQKYKNDKHLYNVEKAPQNMMIVIGKQGDKYALVSIHPEYLCKILNGEKTIEVRKKVLKGMLK